MTPVFHSVFLRLKSREPRTCHGSAALCGPKWSAFWTRRRVSNRWLLGLKNFFYHLFIGMLSFLLKFFTFTLPPVPDHLPSPQSLIIYPPPSPWSFTPPPVPDQGASKTSGRSSEEERDDACRERGGRGATYEGAMVVVVCIKIKTLLPCFCFDLVERWGWKCRWNRPSITEEVPQTTGGGLQPFAHSPFIAFSLHPVAS